MTELRPATCADNVDWSRVKDFAHHGSGLAGSVLGAKGSLIALLTRRGCEVFLSRWVCMEAFWSIQS